MVKRLVVAIVALAFAACASTTSGRLPVAGSQTPPTHQPPATSDIADLRQQLEEERTAILARESKPVASTPTVDIDAAASMPIPDHRLVRSAVTLFSGSLGGVTASLGIAALWG